MKEEYVLTPGAIQCVQAILAKGDRVELAPGPRGEIKVLHVRRRAVAPKGAGGRETQSNSCP